MCWPVPLGDQEPYSEDSGIEWYGYDYAGSEMGHCVDGAPDTDTHVLCIKTVGTRYTSDSDYGIVCIK